MALIGTWVWHSATYVSEGSFWFMMFPLKFPKNGVKTSFLWIKFRILGLWNDITILILFVMCGWATCYTDIAPLWQEEKSDHTAAEGRYWWMLIGCKPFMFRKNIWYFSNTIFLSFVSPSWYIKFGIFPYPTLTSRMCIQVLTLGHCLPSVQGVAPKQ